MAVVETRIQTTDHANIGGILILCALYPVDYPTYPLLGNRLVPFAAGTTTITSTFSNGSAASITRSINVTFKDTYQSAWPAAAAVSDTTALVQANMSDAFTVTYQLVPSSQLDLVADAPSASTVEKAGRRTCGPAECCRVAVVAPNQRIFSFNQGAASACFHCEQKAQKLASLCCMCEYRMVIRLYSSSWTNLLRFVLLSSLSPVHVALHCIAVVLQG